MGKLQNFLKVGLLILGFLLGSNGPAVAAVQCRSSLDAAGNLPGLQVLPQGSIRREENVEKLGSSLFDVLIIGGGSAGLGAAVDASQRGLKVALVEATDFAAETSSRSTKLLHGGVRYLEQLVMGLLKERKFDQVMYNLIRDALHERKTVLKIAPHLSNPVAIVTPIYKNWEIPYYWAGLKAYDKLAGKAGQLPGSRFVSAREIIREFPLIEQKGLKGGVVYYDGQFNDARMAVALAMTAQKNGAVVTNHTPVVDLIKENGRVSGAKVVDALSGREISVNAKVVINATGPFSDKIRRMDDPSAKAMIAASSGVHLVLSPKFVAPVAGILIPKTEDGRVLFILPWEGHTLIGTTDTKADVVSNPKATEAEIEEILREAGKYFSQKPERSDVLSYWSGLRPLVSDPKSQDTAKLARDHVVQVSDSHLITIAGGKWTTYRKMAEDVVDRAVSIGQLAVKEGTVKTDNLILVGGENFHTAALNHWRAFYDVDGEVIKHLRHNYGDRAELVLQLGRELQMNRRLIGSHPFLESEVVYAYKVEGARTATDVIARRLRLAFLDKKAAATVLPRVIEIMGSVAGWNDQQKLEQEIKAKQDLELERESSFL